MKLRPHLLMAFIVALGISALAQTADELVSRMITARGGMEKIKAMQSRRETGKIAFGPNTEGIFIADLERPNKLRIEVLLPNGTMVQAYDGKTGWQLTPGADTPFVMDQAQQKSMGEQADFDGPLVDYKPKGNSVEAIGGGEIDGRKTYRLKVTLANGDVQFYELDAETYLPVRWRGTRTAQGQEIPVESAFSDFRDVSGVKFPFSVESFVEGKLVQQMTVDTREANVKIDPSRFVMPGAKPAAAK
jgi:outer membrane lipoprotein-sorting protein